MQIKIHGQVLSLVVSVHLCPLYSQCPLHYFQITKVIHYLAGHQISLPKKRTVISDLLHRSYPGLTPTDSYHWHRIHRSHMWMWCEAKCRVNVPSSSNYDKRAASFASPIVTYPHPTPPPLPLLPTHTYTTKSTISSPQLRCLALTHEKGLRNNINCLMETKLILKLRFSVFRAGGNLLPLIN